MPRGKPSFKYKDIALSLETRIASGDFTPGVALPNERDLSVEYGVSHLTLRKAMEILVRSGRVTRRPGHGTFVVDRNADGAEPGKAILYVGDVKGDFFRELYFAILKKAQGIGSTLATVDPCSVAGGDVRRLGRRMHEASGIICTKASLKAITPFAKSHRKTVVVADIYDDGTEPFPCYTVSSNVFLAVRMATEHLLGLGHRRIAFVGAPDMPSGHSEFRVPARSRRTYQGFMAAFFMVGTAVPKDCAVGPLGEEIAECEASTFAWLKTLAEWPTGFVCEGDFRAAALLRAAARLGRRAPADFSVTGTGNTPWCEMAVPSITSVSMGEEEMAETAVLLASLPPPSNVHALQATPKLVVRESTGAVRRGRLRRRISTPTGG
jgi:LacI family transcriptional regulator